MLKLTYDGSEYELDATPGDLVRFERQYGIPATQLESETRIEYVMYLAWLALKRVRPDVVDFDDFLDRVTDVEDSPTAPLAKRKR